MEVEMIPITSFRGYYFFLSNFYPSLTFFEEKFYSTAEHAYQAAKTDDPKLRNWIAEAPTPSEAKTRGNVLKLNQRKWDKRRLVVMERVLEGKFFVSHSLCVMLEKTAERQLIEGNDHGDKYWGCVFQNGRWVGENQLGKLLMKLRDERLWKVEE